MQLKCNLCHLSLWIGPLGFIAGFATLSGLADLALFGESWVAHGSALLGHTQETLE